MPRERAFWPIVSLVAVLAVILGSRLSLADPTSRALAVVLTLGGTLVIVGIPGVALLALFSKRTTPPSCRFGLILAGSGTAGMAAFWVWFFSPTMGRGFAVIVLIASNLIIASTAPSTLLRDRDLSRPVLLGLLIALAFTGLAYSQGGLNEVVSVQGQSMGNTVDAVSYRYWLAPDNTVPLLFAERIAAHTALFPFLGDLHTSDRPPLQTGFFLSIFPFLGRRAFSSQLLGTALESMWVPALWLALKSRGYATIRVALVVFAAAATGAMFLNTVYLWPKMLAGTLVLAALVVCLDGGSIVLVAALATLGLLSHGGIAFSVLALLPFLLRLRPTIRSLLLAVGAAGALYVPWILYQRLVDPPGDRLLKWMLAGVYLPDHDTFLSDLTRQYTSVSLFLHNKLNNLENLFAPWRWWNGFKADPAWYGWVSQVRVATITSLFWSAGPLVLGLIGLASPRIRAMLRPAVPLFTFVVLSIFFWVILLFGGGQVTGNNSTTLIHQGPYAAIVLFIALAALATSYLPRVLSTALFVASLLWFFVAWVPGLGFHDAQPGIETSPDWAMVGLSLVAIVAIGCLVGRMVRGEGATADRLNFHKEVSLRA